MAERTVSLQLVTVPGGALVRGYTRPHSDALKAAGGVWDAELLAWRFNGTLPASVAALIAGLTTIDGDGGRAVPAVVVADAANGMTTGFGPAARFLPRPAPVADLEALLTCELAPLRYDMDTFGTAPPAPPERQPARMDEATRHRVITLHQDGLNHRCYCCAGRILQRRRAQDAAQRGSWAWDAKDSRGDSPSNYRAAAAEIPAGRNRPACGSHTRYSARPSARRGCVHRT